MRRLAWWRAWGVSLLLLLLGLALMVAGIAGQKGLI